MTKLKKRTWCYTSPPRRFDFPPCSCGNLDTLWSEYRKHLWCPVCEKDFIPDYQGIFDGPIPIGIATMLGINFDRYDLVAKKFNRLNIETMEYEDDE